MTDYASFNDRRIKHMEMIQAVLARLGNDSFFVKGWAITVAGAFLGFAVNLENASLALASVLPTFLFWTLDTYYLWSERLFRDLYDLVREGSEDVEPFFMGATTDDFIEIANEQPERGAATRREVFRSRTLWRFYAAIIGSAIFLALLICFG